MAMESVGGTEAYYWLDLIKRASDVLEMIAEKDQMSVAELAKTLGQDRNAINRIVLTFSDLGYLTRLDNKRYALTMKLFRLGSQALNSASNPKLVNLHMKGLARLFGETICFGQRHDLEVLTIDVISSSLPVRYVSHIGNTAPLQNAAMGKCILAAMDNSRLEGLIERLNLKPHTPKSITTKNQLWREIRQIRKQGYAFDDEEWSEGVRCLGIPVYDQDGRCKHALSVSGLAGNFTGERFEKMVEKLLEVKNRLILDMGLSGLRV
jgi:DNA-binding IclR family transcriptional regulator